MRLRILVPIVLLTGLLLPAQDQFRRLNLAGHVVLPDGSPPPEPVLIRLYCHGRRDPQGYTNAEGKFSFAVGGSQSRVVLDPSRGLGSGPVGARGADQSFVDMTGCTVKAELPGYTSSEIDLGRRSVFENPEIGTLVITPAGKGRGALQSETTRSAPRKAFQLYEKAQKELAKPKPNAAKAAKELEKAVKRYPQFAAAWNLLGEARARLNDIPGARQALEKSVAADPKYAPPCVTLALLDLQQKRPEDAMKMADHALELIPNLAEAHYYRAIAASSLGNLGAVKQSLRAVQASPDAARYPRTHFMLGNLYLQQGDMAAAVTEFERYLKLEPNSRAAQAVRKQLEQWKAEGRLSKKEGK